MDVCCFEVVHPPPPFPLHSPGPPPRRPFTTSRHTGSTSTHSFHKYGWKTADSWMTHGFYTMKLNCNQFVQMHIILRFENSETKRICNPPILHYITFCLYIRNSSTLWRMRISRNIVILVCSILCVMVNVESGGAAGGGDCRWMAKGLTTTAVWRHGHL